MKSVRILWQVPADLRAFVLLHLNNYGAAQTITDKLGGVSDDLLRFADERAVQWRWRIFCVEEFSRDQRIRNLAERLVVAGRIEAARGENLATGAKSQRRTGAGALLAAA